MDYNEVLDTIKVAITKGGQRVGVLDVKIGVIGDTGEADGSVGGVAAADIPPDIAQALGIEPGEAILWDHVVDADTTFDENIRDLWDHVRDFYPDELDGEGPMGDDGKKVVTITVEQLDALITKAASGNNSLPEATTPAQLVDKLLEDDHGVPIRVFVPDTLEWEAVSAAAAEIAGASAFGVGNGTYLKGTIDQLRRVLTNTDFMIEWYGGEMSAEEVESVLAESIYDMAHGEHTNWWEGYHQGEVDADAFADQLLDKFLNTYAIEPGSTLADLVYEHIYAGLT